MICPSFFVCQKEHSWGHIREGRDYLKVVSARISPAAPSRVLLKGEGIGWMGDGGAPGGAPGGRLEALECGLPPYSTTRNLGKWGSTAT